MKKMCAREAPDKGESLWRGWAQPCGFSVSHVSWWIQTAHPLFDFYFFHHNVSFGRKGALLIQLESPRMKGKVEGGRERNVSYI